MPEPTLDPALQADLDATGATSRWVTSGDVRLHVLDYGGEGRPVLVLPGITSPAVTWDFLVRALPDGLRYVVPDVRGRGLSDRSDGAYAMSDYAADAKAVVEALGLERPIVLAHSMGAWIGAHFAAAHPDLVGELVLVDPPLSGPGRDPYPTSLDAFLAQLHEGQRGTTADEVRRFYPRWPESELELRARWLPTCDEQAVVETHRGFHTGDFFDVWPQLAGSPLLVRGGASPVVTDAGAEELAQALPAAQVVTVPNAGHMVPWDEFDAFLAPVGSFLTNCRNNA
jgi:N-formylmaleamate deformylase